MPPSMMIIEKSFALDGYAIGTDFRDNDIVFINLGCFTNIQATRFERNEMITPDSNHQTGYFIQNIAIATRISQSS